MKIQEIHITPEVTEHAEFYTAKEGSQSIASPRSMASVLSVIQRVQPKTILELGGGIGSLAHLCLKYTDARLDTYEDNAFCIDALKKNLQEFEGRYRILTDYNDTSELLDAYDLVIGDGGPYNLIDEIVTNRKIRTVYFDGARWGLQKKFQRALRDVGVCDYTKFIFPESASKCGFLLVCTPEERAFKRHISYAGNRLSMQREKIKKRGLKRIIKSSIKGNLKKIPFLVRLKRKLFS